MEAERGGSPPAGICPDSGRCRQQCCHWGLYRRPCTPHTAPSPGRLPAPEGALAESVKFTQPRIWAPPTTEGGAEAVGGGAGGGVWEGGRGSQGRGVRAHSARRLPDPAFQPLHRSHSHFQAKFNPRCQRPREGLGPPGCQDGDQGCFHPGGGQTHQPEGTAPAVSGGASLVLAKWGGGSEPHLFPHNPGSAPDRPGLQAASWV